MNQKKLQQLQKQYNTDDYQEEDEADELLQENSDLYDEEAYIVNKPAKKSNKLGGVITQVEQGATQPQAQQESDIPSDFFVESEIVIGPQRK